MGRRRVRKERLNKPTPARAVVDNDLTQWDTTDIDANKIPYVSHVPSSPIHMSSKRKARIKKVLKLKEEGKTPDEIAEILKVNPVLIKRDLTTAMVLAAENKPYMTKEDRNIVVGAVQTFTDEAKALMVRIKNVITELEDAKAYNNPKQTAGFAMILGELRQTLELGAKLSGELQTGTKVNVVVFSGMIKRLIEIISEEVDRGTFIRIRDRIKLEMQGKEPLGEKGGKLHVIEEEEL